MSRHTLSLLAQITGAEELDQSEIQDIVEDVVEKSQEEIVEMAAELAVKEVEGEVQKLAEEVDGVVEAVDEIEEQVEELEEAVEGTEALLNSPTWNPAAAAILYGQAEKYNRKLGGKNPTTVLGAESMGNAVDARLAMQDGLESFMDTIKKHAESAWKYVVSLFETAKAWVLSLFNEAEKLKRQVAALKEVVKNKELKASDKVKGGDWTARSQVTSFERVKEIIGAAEQMIASADAIKDGNVGPFASAHANYVSVIKKLQGEKKEESGAIKVKVAAFTFTFTVYDKEITDMKTAAEAAKAVRARLEVNKEVVKSAASNFKAYTDKSKLNEHLGYAEKAIKVIEDAKKAKSASDEGKNKLVKAIKDMEGKDKEFTKPAITCVKNIASAATTITKAVVDYTNQVGKAHIACVKAHV